MDIARKLNGRIYRLAISATRRNPAPDRIPLSPPKSLKNDFHETTLSDKGNRASYFLIESLSKYGAEGKYFNTPGEGGYAACIPNAVLSSLEFYNRHFIFGHELRTKSVFLFLLQWLTNYARFAVWKKNTAQYFFNRKRLVRQDRIDVLRTFIDQTIKNPDYKIDATDLLKDLHSSRAFLHPQGTETTTYYRLILDAFVESGELALTQRGYKLNPMGLTSLTTFELEEARFRQAMWHQRLLAGVTAVLVLVGMLQAYVVYNAA